MLLAFNSSAFHSHLRHRAAGISIKMSKVFGLLFWAFFINSNGLEVDKIEYGLDLAKTICRTQKDFASSNMLQAQPLKKRPEDMPGLNLTTGPATCGRAVREGNKFKLVQCEPDTSEPLEARKAAAKEYLTGRGTALDQSPADGSYVVSIQRKEGDKYVHYAMGVIAGKSIVATTAEVVLYMNFTGMENYRIVAGATDLRLVNENNTEIQIREIKSFGVHPWFTEARSWVDLGRLRTNRIFKFSRRVQKSSFSKQSTAKALLKIIEGLPCYVIGWQGQDVGADTKLMNNSAEVVPHAKCSETYRFNDTSFPRDFCIGNQGFSPCFGHIGGPVVCWIEAHKSMEVIGLVSKVKYCGAKDEPAFVYNTMLDTSTGYFYYGERMPGQG